MCGVGRLLSSTAAACLAQQGPAQAALPSCLPACTALLHPLLLGPLRCKKSRSERSVFHVSPSPAVPHCSTAPPAGCGCHVQGSAWARDPNPGGRTQARLRIQGARTGASWQQQPIGAAQAMGATRTTCRGGSCWCACSLQGLLAGPWHRQDWCFLLLQKALTDCTSRISAPASVQVEPDLPASFLPACRSRGGEKSGWRHLRLAVMI